jgi:hypothetical protein
MFTCGQDRSNHGVRSFLQDFPMKAVYNRKWTTSSSNLIGVYPPAILTLYPIFFNASAIFSRFSP